MAVFDLKKATIKLCDGRKAVLTTTAANGVNARVTLTDQSTHRGSQPPVSITLLDPLGNSQALSITVSGTDITAHLATDGGGAITTTATQLKAALDASAPALALVATTLPGSGAAIVSAQAKTNLATGPHTLTLKIAEGTIDYTEHKNRKYTKDGGKLGTVMDGDQEPIDVTFDAIWDFIKGDGSGTPTVEDFLKQRGDASGYVTTDTDACQPFCIDIEVYFAPGCSPTQNEYITLELFRYESLGRQFKNGVFKVSGKCNVVEAILLRV